MSENSVNESVAREAHELVNRSLRRIDRILIGKKARAILFEAALAILSNTDRSREEALTLYSERHLRVFMPEAEAASEIVQRWREHCQRRRLCWTIWWPIIREKLRRRLEFELTIAYLRISPTALMNFRIRHFLEESASSN